MRTVVCALAAVSRLPERSHPPAQRGRRTARAADASGIGSSVVPNEEQETRRSR
jgi:hypothetical protein